MISDIDLFVNKYVSVPRDMGGLTCAAFIAGIVRGCLDNAGFPARCALDPAPPRRAHPCFTPVHPLGPSVPTKDVAAAASPFETSEAA